VAGAEGSAVAYVRGSGPSRLVVAVNAGDTATRLEIQLDDDLSTGRDIVSIELPGSEGRLRAPVAGGRATIELAAVSGAVMRVT
jgi:hypothetical protein